MKLFNSLQIDVAKFEKDTHETYIHLLKTFPWSSIPDSLHVSMAHAAELMTHYGGYGLGNITEEQVGSTGSQHSRQYFT